MVISALHPCRAPGAVPRPLAARPWRRLPGEGGVGAQDQPQDGDRLRPGGQPSDIPLSSYRRSVVVLMHTFVVQFCGQQVQCSILHEVASAQLRSAPMACCGGRSAACRDTVACFTMLPRAAVHNLCDYHGPIVNPERTRDSSARLLRIEHRLYTASLIALAALWPPWRVMAFCMCRILIAHCRAWPAATPSPRASSCGPV